jgi:uncharacterized protein YbjT (DUF2867 family)
LEALPEEVLLGAVYPEALPEEASGVHQAAEVEVVAAALTEVEVVAAAALDVIGCVEIVQLTILVAAHSAFAVIG